VSGPVDTIASSYIGLSIAFTPMEKKKPISHYARRICITTPKGKNTTIGSDPENIQMYLPRGNKPYQQY
jgi:hypothetical protein